MVAVQPCMEWILIKIIKKREEEEQSLEYNQEESKELNTLEELKTAITVLLIWRVIRI